MAHNVMHSLSNMHDSVVDAPSITQVLYNHLKPFFTSEEKLPAKLMIFVAGCPNICGGTLAGDIVIVGHYGQAPKPDPERIKFCLPASAEALKKAVPDVAAVCPVGAIKVFGNQTVRWLSRLMRGSA